MRKELNKNIKQLKGSIYELEITNGSVF